MTRPGAGHAGCGPHPAHKFSIIYLMRIENIRQKTGPFAYPLGEAINFRRAAGWPARLACPR